MTFIGLKKERTALYGDIEKRVDKMFDNGLVSEVRGLLENGYDDFFSLRQAVGYKEVLEYIKGKSASMSVKDWLSKIPEDLQRNR